MENKVKTNILTLPDDVHNNYIYKNNNFVLVKDPKHTDEVFHYTIWYLLDIKNIMFITCEYLKELKNFIKEVKKLNLWKNEKMYFTYKPTHDRIHLHILPTTYISHRPLYELYDYNDINLIHENISVITLLPLFLIIIFNLLVFLISKRENLENYKISNQNIFDVKNIK